MYIWFIKKMIAYDAVPTHNRSPDKPPKVTNPSNLLQVSQNQKPSQ